MQPHELMQLIRCANVGEMREWLIILREKSDIAYNLFVTIVKQAPPKRFEKHTLNEPS